MSVRKSAWVFGVPGYLTIEYESGKKPDTTGAPSRPRSEPSLRFWDWEEVGNMPVAKRTQGLHNPYGRRMGRTDLGFSTFSRSKSHRL